MSNELINSRPMAAIPEPTLRRLPGYLAYVRTLKADNVTTVSSTQIAREFNQDPTQITKDLAFTGATGKTRVGYVIDDLIETLEVFLGFRKNNEAFLIGAGSLGTALIRYSGFNSSGLKIIAAFDNDPLKVGQKISGVPVFGLDKLRDLLSRMHIRIAILTVPATDAQSLVDLLVAWGINAIWNFAPLNIKTPPHVIVENTSLFSSLAVLLQQLEAKDKPITQTFIQN